MAFDTEEKNQIEESLSFFIESKRPPKEIRSKVDLSFRIDGQSIIIYEIRPVWNNPDKIQHLDIAKATYVRTPNTWKIYWQRSDLKWHTYDPIPEVPDLTSFYTVLHEDKHHCFWG